MTEDDATDLLHAAAGVEMYRGSVVRLDGRPSATSPGSRRSPSGGCVPAPSHRNGHRCRRPGR